MRKPLCIDLFCGLGGWTEGFLAEGWDVVGFDIVRHEYGWKDCPECQGTGNFYRHDEDGDYLPCDCVEQYRTAFTEHEGKVPNRYPAQLVLQDVLTLHGSQFRNADCIVASPPCQQYSLWGMRMFHPNPAPPDKQLWESAVRIGHQAHVPTIVENVRGAQYWWGKASWKCGPYYFWGATPALWPDIPLKRKNVVDDVKNGDRRGLRTNANFSSTSEERRRLTAEAAKIPFDLAAYVARHFKPIVPL